MNRYARQFLGGAALTLLVACATAAPPPATVVLAPAAERAAMAGEWWGRYWSAESGRSGSIELVLDVDSGAARGDVWMYASELPAPAGGRAEHHRHGGSQLLTIGVVRVAAGGAVTGTMEPYPDPDCDCLLSTSFTGTLSGDLAEGTFVTRGKTNHPETTGHWRVERRRTGE